MTKLDKSNKPANNCQIITDKGKTSPGSKPLTREETLVRFRKE